MRSAMISIIFLENDQIISSQCAQQKLPDPEKFVTIFIAEKNVKVILKNFTPDLYKNTL
jgi:hypothetical protein